MSERTDETETTLAIPWSVPGVAVHGWSDIRAGTLVSAAAAKLATSLGPRIFAAETQEVLRRLA